MATNVVMPQMGESIAEGTITKWLKRPGEKVGKDEALLEISTDKVDTEIPSPAAGVLGKIVAEEGKTVEVGSVIAVIVAEGEAAEVAPAPAAASPQAAAPAPAKAPAATAPPAKAAPAVAAKAPAAPKAPPPPPPAPAPAQRPAVPAVAAGAAGKLPRMVDGRFLSPLVRSIAGAEGISERELAGIHGTGASGRLTRDDLLGWLAQRPSAAAAAGPLAVPGQDTEVPVDRMRSLIAKHMTESIRTSAHVYTMTECDMTGIVAFRERNKDSFEERTGEKLTFTPFFVKAAALALRDFPYVNAQIDLEKARITLKGDINVGMAVAVPKGDGTFGLIVPVIRNADQLPLREIARQVNDLAKRGRESALRPDEPQGGTFTITNMGVFGSLGGLPIINQPQVAILGLGAIQKRPAVRDGQIVARDLLFMSLGFDHRLVDGALGGMFLERIRHYLENFDAWILQ